MNSSKSNQMNRTAEPIPTKATIVQIADSALSSAMVKVQIPKEQDDLQEAQNEQLQQEGQQQQQSQVKQDDVEDVKMRTRSMATVHEEGTTAEPSKNHEEDNNATTTTTTLPNAVSESESENENENENDASTTTSSEDQQAEEPQEPAMDTQEPSPPSEDDAVQQVRRSIARGIADQISQTDRIEIVEEVHGVQTMGLSFEEESNPHVVLPLLSRFQDALDSRQMDPSCGSATAAYELCIEKNYLYATNDRGDLRLVCLRAELWDPIRACDRFLKHLTALYKFYGEDGLKQPVDIDLLDYEERHMPAIVNTAFKQDKEKAGIRRRNSAGEIKGIYKKGKGGCKRKGSLDSLPDMLSLKSGSIQVLPSRDRSGRRVVVLQPSMSFATTQQTIAQAQKSKFKAMIFFLCTLLRRDVDAQRKGFVLILNSTKSDDLEKESNYDETLIDQYRELYESVPIRFSAVHFCFDKESTNSVSHKISITTLQSYLDQLSQSNMTRIHLYDKDVSSDSTKSELASFGIPTHQIPVTHTGTIKLKEHNAWVKIQEWYNKTCKNPNGDQLFQKFNVIECPGTNDVLFSQGGKYWNGVNRFQRGNLEFMEFLESKIDIYQSTLSWKKKHSILAEVVSEFARSPQRTGSHPRFLETATQIEGVTAPDGCWVELPLNSPLLMQKIRQTLLNHIRRLESSGKRKPASTKATRGNKKATKQKKDKKQKLDASSVKNSSISKKRKMVHDSTSPVMKNNKLAMATFGNSITSTFHPLRADDSLSNIHKQSICEFLANAERIAVSTAAVDLACSENAGLDDLDASNNGLHDDIAGDEKLVQAIIANDERLNKEVGELFEMDSFLRDEEDGNEIEPDEIADCLMGCML